jgi:hypothetical protein
MSLAFGPSPGKQTHTVPHERHEQLNGLRFGGKDVIRNMPQIKRPFSPEQTRRLFSFAQGVTPDTGLRVRHPLVRQRPTSGGDDGADEADHAEDPAVGPAGGRSRPDLMQRAGGARQGSPAGDQLGRRRHPELVRVEPCRGRWHGQSPRARAIEIPLDHAGQAPLRVPLHGPQPACQPSPSRSKRLARSSKPAPAMGTAPRHGAATCHSTPAIRPVGKAGSEHGTGASQGPAGSCVQVRPFQRSIKIFPTTLPEL